MNVFTTGVDTRGWYINIIQSVQAAPGFPSGVENWGLLAKYIGQRQSGKGCELFGEQLSNILEGFELKCIAGGIEKEHGGLFARQSFEADIGLDDETDGAFFQSFFQLVPFVPFQYDAIVGDGDVVAVDRIGVEPFFFFRAGFQVDDELVAVEIEVHPGIGASAFFAAQHVAIEFSGLLQIIDGDGDVKGGEFFHLFVKVEVQTYKGIDYGYGLRY